MNSVVWWKDFAATLQSFGTLIAACVGGVWAYYRFGLGQERYPHIETAADIQFIGQHGDDWIVELAAYVENKGRAQHKMVDLNFELSSINRDDALEDAEEFGGQVLFPHLLKKESLLGDFEYFVVDAGVKAKYSYVTKVPKSASFVILHCMFNYADKRKFSHTSEKTAMVPKAA
jgi:hypothetical protein